MIILQNGETGVLTIEKPFDTVDLEWQDDGTAVVTLYDENGTAITNATALAMAHVGATTGRNTLYRCEVAHTVTLPGGTFGEAVATFTSAGGKVGIERVTVRYDA
jgi:hypothetical protein